jgi:hypothetical protein
MSAGRFQFAIFALIGTAAVAGQLSQVSQGAPQAPQDGNVRVYVYRAAVLVDKEFRPSVYVDDTDVAKLQSGRNVTLALPPGTHTFRSSDKKEQVSLDVKPGERYFVRIDVTLAVLKGHGKAVLVLPEQAMPEYAQTKPADKGMVKGGTLIAPEFIAK